MVARLILVLLVVTASKVRSTVLINEVAYSGSVNVCSGQDWIEIHNDNDASTNLAGFTLYDDKGPADDDARVFNATEMVLAAGEYKVLCRGIDFAFGVGGSDTVSLLDASSTLASSSGAMPDTGSDDETYALSPGGEYAYTTTPTPGAVNVITVQENNLEEMLTEQNALGLDFFRMNDDGTLRASSSFAEVVDIYVDLAAADLIFMQENPAHEDYVPVDQYKIVSGGVETILASGGRMRTKGQSTLVFPACLGLANVPFRLDFDTRNASQTLFGMETAYLRNHLMDQSYMRDYTMHRLNARFGLPFLRTRPVRLFLSNTYIGFYTLMEAPDQGYVMQRSFGAYDPTQTSLFKFKTMAGDCGAYSQGEFDGAEARAVPDPYYFERGEHRDAIPVNADCTSFFLEQLAKEREDVVKGWAEYDQDCGLAMVELGLVDRDFGPSALESSMAEFLNSHIYTENGEPSPSLPGAVDADQWLKTFAAYAVTVNMDSPLNNLNNWYLATTAGGSNWRIVQYDHNNVLTRDGAGLCAGPCSNRQIYWPVLRPSCGSTETHRLLGPLLAVEGNSAAYLSYVEEFAGLLTPAFFAELRAYREAIKDFVAADPLYDASAAAAELSEGPDGYNTAQMPLIKTLEARKQQVDLQLQAIEAGTLPRSGDAFSEGERCPDWRDPDGDSYISSTTFVGSAAGCNAECAAAGPCFDNYLGICQADGTIPEGECFEAGLSCTPCFPHSRCGGQDDTSAIVTSTAGCTDELEGACAEAAGCFDHYAGACAFDGELLIEECKVAELCKPCFANSRCSDAAGAAETTPEPSTGFALKVSASLAGVSAAELLANLGGFRSAVAKVHAGKVADDVVVDEASIKDVATARRRRRLLADGVSVDYAIQGFASAADAASAKTLQEAAAADLVANLKAEGFSGLSEVTSAASVTDASGTVLEATPASAAAVWASWMGTLLAAVAVLALSLR